MTSGKTSQTSAHCGGGSTCQEPIHAYIEEMVSVFAFIWSGFAMLARCVCRGLNDLSSLCVSSLQIKGHKTWGSHVLEAYPVCLTVLPSGL